jgi:hypothetical protein
VGAAHHHDRNGGNDGTDRRGRLSFAKVNPIPRIGVLTMTYRTLRIAFSAVCGVLCLLLIALWVRSYLVADNLVIRTSNVINDQFHSENGGLSVGRFQPIQHFLGWHWRTDAPIDPPNGFRYGRLPSGGLSIEVPYWFLVFVAAIPGTLPWLGFLRFSLRAMLVATTLLAILLGLIVYAASWLHRRNQPALSFGPSASTLTLTCHAATKSGSSKNGSARLVGLSPEP